MRIIDARSGDEVVIGKWVTYPPPTQIVRGKWDPQPCPHGGVQLPPGEVVSVPNAGVDVPGHGRVDEGSFRLLRVKDRLLWANGYFEMADGTKHWRPFYVRFSHPGFPGERILFVPS